MKSIIFVILIIAALLFLTTSKEEINEDYTQQTMQAPKKTYHDTPINTYEQQIEAQSIANTIQPSSSYLGSRIDARGDAKDSVQIANEQMKAREEALESF